ncbi:MAG: hypothetical protein ABSB78_14155 [Bacteroidota bacterium]
MRKIFFILFTITLFITGCSSSQNTISTLKTQYQIIGQSGSTYMVVVKPEIENNKNELMQISKYICNKKEFCYIDFWDNINLAARTGNITDAQDSAIIATYGINKTTNYEQLLVCGLGEC